MIPIFEFRDFDFSEDNAFPPKEKEKREKIVLHLEHFSRKNWEAIKRGIFYSDAAIENIKFIIWYSKNFFM